MDKIYIVTAVLFTVACLLSWRVSSNMKRRKCPPGAIAFGVQACVYGFVAVFTGAKYFF
ncbi:hypothetical protein pEaSNUABM6_00139 [Erwinia phage pEa_SNUABM_6]|nr:hypothetical protein pEaSNUABM6_00139 [Erwinia phage pEa_SNUABM_6]